MIPRAGQQKLVIASPDYKGNRGENFGLPKGGKHHEWIQAKQGKECTQINKQKVSQVDASWAGLRIK